MADCNTRVGKGTITWQCDLEGGHTGPCRAKENRPSVSARERWEAQQRHEASGLDEFQGRAQTTAERYTENPTPPPGQEDRFDIARGPKALKRCSACFQGNHADCDVYVDEGAVDALDFVGLSCSCHDEDPEAHDNARYPERLERFEPTKQRPGDQPLPRQTGDTSVQDRIIEKTYLAVEQGILTEDAAEVVIAKMEESKRVGTERYGTPLQTFNGRDTLQDAIEEARDLFVYLSSLEEAREATRERLIEVVTDALAENYDEGDVSTRGMATVAVDAILKATGGL